MLYIAVDASIRTNALFGDVPPEETFHRRRRSTGGDFPPEETFHRRRRSTGGDFPPERLYKSIVF